MNTSAALAEAETRAFAFSLQLRPDSWFDLMHWHPDIDGEGDGKPSARAFFLGLARRYLDVALAELRVSGRPYQCWFLAERDRSSEDAVYVHTPNPSGENFPYEFADVAWRDTAPEWLAEHFPESEFQHGVSHGGSGVLFWVVPRSLRSEHGV